MAKNLPTNSSPIARANALLCPNCCVELGEVELDFEFDGTIIRNVKALRCPSCGEESFSPKQHAELMKKIGAP